MRPHFVLALTLLGCAGCLRNDYEVELTPGKDSVDRKLTVTRHSFPHPKDVEADVERLAKEYQAPVPAADKRQTFRGEFSSRMPNDIGGHGTSTRWETSLGSVGAYVERFRGSDDIFGVLKRREAAVHRLTDMTIGWLERELADDPRWPQLRTFLDEQFRHDLINLGIYVWSFPLWSHESDVSAVGVSLVQYLIEHGYLQPEEIPEILRAHREAEQENFEPLLVLFRRQISSRMGIAEEAPPNFAFLESAEEFRSSLSAYLVTTEEYAKLEQEWRESKVKSDPPKEKPDPLAVISVPLMPLVFGNLFSDYDQVSVTLKTGRPAFKTNGEWSDERKEIYWRKDQLPHSGLTPKLLYAFWDEPNSEKQLEHFGSVVLEGQTLLNYCLWYHGLSANERQEWDAFLNTLQPGVEGESRLRNFRFRHEAADLAADRSLAKTAVEALLPKKSE